VQLQQLSVEFGLFNLNVKVNMSGEILFYYENTAVKMKMKNSILLDS